MRRRTDRKEKEGRLSGSFWNQDDRYESEEKGRVGGIMDYCYDGSYEGLLTVIFRAYKDRGSLGRVNSGLR